MTDAERIEINNFATSIMEGATDPQDLFAGAKRVYDLTKNSDWTPCAEGLPEENGTYLVFAPSYRGGSSSGLDVINGIMFSRFKSGKWSIEHGYYNRPNCVIAWQPLPEPYNPDHIGEANKKED